MSVMTASEIAARAGGAVIGAGDARATSWAFDSRALEPGACFVALHDHRDGHDFVADAFASGATVALVERELSVPTGCALVRVPNALAALQAVARAVRESRADVRVVAVAGSTGKTSTKDLLASVLEPLGVHANDASFNNEFGLPITLCNTPAAAHVVVTEMGERLPGDLALLCDIAQPDVGVVTNAGLAHAEHLGGLDGTIAVLAELVAALPASGVFVGNADDASFAALVATSRAPVLGIGRGAIADVRITDVEMDDELRPTFCLDGHRLAVPLHGAHHVENAALAAATARHAFGMDYADIADGMRNVTGGRWRMELFETDAGVTVLNDAYNANPTSMNAALAALAHLEVKGRRIAVLGEMRELGAHHQREHAELGRRVSELPIDVLIGVGDGGAAIVAAAGEHVSAHRVPDAHAASALVGELAAPGDAVLVKGSRALGLEIVAEALLATRGSRA
jgi:UDP-N-acetylmuramoyl-tripeptide--D-alanyl-D-alanine ligase